MKRGIRKFKNGVASFYIVAFASLILVIVASSFAMVVVSEVNRASDSDLSRSAYDSAMAGVEDAKLALLNYQACIAQGYTYTGHLSNSDTITCEDIIYYMNNPDCDMVAKILGRKIEDNEVKISESAGSNNSMNQAYTCVMISASPSDYRADLDATNNYKVVKVALEDDEAKNIKFVKLSWYHKEDGEQLNFNNFSNGKVEFSSLSNENGEAVPPTLEFQLIQTASEFTLSDISAPARLVGDELRTDRATLYLVPTKEGNLSTNNNSYISAWDDSKGINSISARQFAETNNLEKNLPYVVYCNDQGEGGEYICSALIGLPKPISNDGSRNGDTFMFVVSIPYGQPTTDFALELCKNENECRNQTSDTAAVEDETNTVEWENVVVVDSTGRANDLYRRVEVRLEASDYRSAYLLYAIQATDNDSGGDVGVKKELTVGL
jgi:hypothetical protein